MNVRVHSVYQPVSACTSACERNHHLTKARQQWLWEFSVQCYCSVSLSSCSLISSNPILCKDFWHRDLKLNLIQYFHHSSNSDIHQDPKLFWLWLLFVLFSILPWLPLLPSFLWLGIFQRPICQVSNLTWTLTCTEQLQIGAETWGVSSILLPCQPLLHPFDLAMESHICSTQTLFSCSIG